MTTARTTVLSPPELLELILVHLPQPTLLQAQRVNTTFHSIITSSTPLQRLLFFSPQLPACSNRPTIWQQNPLLVVSFPSFFHIQRSNGPRLWKARGPEAFSSLDWSGGDELRAAYARRDASWRRMLVVQPPVTTLTVNRIVSPSSEGPSEREGKLVTRSGSGHDRVPDQITAMSRIENGPGEIGGRPTRWDLNGEGLTMGVLYDIVEQAVLGGEDSFWFEWHMFPSRYGNSSEPAKYPYTAAEKYNGRFVPRAEMTLFLWTTVYCTARSGERSRLESEAAEIIEMTFTDVECTDMDS